MNGFQIKSVRIEEKELRTNPPVFVLYTNKKQSCFTQWVGRCWEGGFIARRTWTSGRETRVSKEQRTDDRLLR